MPPKVAIVQQMASVLATQHAGEALIQPIGEKWTYNFVKRHDNLQSKFNRKYNYQRAKCEDPVLIRGWFKSVRSVKIEYGILDEDT
jgi:hypothetical protein